MKVVEREVLKCPYNDQDTLSTICLLEAVKKLANKVDDDIKRDYIEVYSERERSMNHETDYELMCELKNHMLLHESKRVETHIIELSLTDPYNHPGDLRMIDAMIKTRIENLQQVYKIRTIVAADKCLGFGSRYFDGEHQEAWLAFCKPNYITVPITKYVFDMKGKDGNYIEPRGKWFESPMIISEMEKLKKENKILYMVIHTYEGTIENPVEYFEELPLFPEWVNETKLLFSWSVKSIMEEEDKEIQEALLQEHFVQSKRYPGYFFNLENSRICDCENFLDAVYCINRKNTMPVGGCLLPMRRSPLQAMEGLCKESELELWEEMFKFAWKTLKTSTDTDSSVSSETESSHTESDQSDHESSNSDNWWPDL